MASESDNPQSAIRNPQSAGKPVLGLLGGIGSGKSLVAAEFARHGGRLVSGDEAGHEALQQPEIIAQVLERWGRDVLDAKGAVNRRKVGAIVFADPAERQALEEMVFPFIGKRLREQIAAAQADPEVRFVVLDAAIMLEAGWNNVCSHLVYVDVPREQRLERIARQRGWTPAEVARRESAQWPVEEKAKRADARIDNSGSPEETARQVAETLRRLGL